MPSRTTRYRFPTRHELYEASVQEPEAEGDFFDQVYGEYNSGRLPLRLREDFCGTAAICRHWVQRRPPNVAVGLDLDPDPLGFARKRLGQMSEDEAGRVKLVQSDVLAPPAGLGKFDVICAFNFSYWIFQQRETLVKYFATARKSLAPGGVFVADFFGGSDCLKELREQRSKRLPRIVGEDGAVENPGGRFTYIWEQAKFNPATGNIVCKISFSVPGPAAGKAKAAKPTLVKHAFTYDWRLYTMPELVDILRDAGFKTVRTYLEKETRSGEGTGKYFASDKASADLCFLAYLVAKD